MSKKYDIERTSAEMNLKDVVFVLTGCWNDVPKKAIISFWKKLWPSMHIKDSEENYDPEDNLLLVELMHALKRTEIRCMRH